MADIYIGNVKGPQGATGATGAQGPQGDAATIEVGTVSTTAYGNTAQVINTGTSSEAVFDFVIPQGRPGEETTTMSSLTLDTVTAQSAEYPIPATGESGAVVFGKIIKFFNDIKTAVNSKINISDIVNNLTSTATNKPLSAAQGKALNDALSSTNDAVSALTATESTTLSIFIFHKIGKMVIVTTRDDGRLNPIQQFSNVGTLPTNYRPAYGFVSPMAWGGYVNVPGAVRITTSGAVDIYASSAQSNVPGYVNCTYYTN